MKPMIGNEVRAQVGRCRLDGPPPGFGHLWPTCVRSDLLAGCAGKVAPLTRRCATSCFYPSDRYPFEGGGLLFDRLARPRYPPR